MPKPCTAEDVAKIETWLDTKEVQTKDEVMLENFGYTDERSANAAVSPTGRSLCLIIAKARQNLY